nr:uracil-DNA glycosylase [Ureaplasma sp.]
ILGQDPYHTPNVANGLAFSVNNELNYTPPSLRNIFKELKSDLNIDRSNTNLEDWVNQGVFLINTILTVYENQPLSCSEWGWEEFILNWINYLNLSNSRYIYVLLGNHAKKYIKYINLDKDIIIQSSHPSPLSYKKGFENSKIFSKINKKISEINKEQIKW